MPIYAYRCESCGHAQDLLQKISDPVLTQCPACGAQSFKKQVTAAGFQLKGTGWYVTDFRGGNNAASGPVAEPAASKEEGASPAPASPAAPSASPAAPASSPTPAPAPASSTKPSGIE